MKQGGIGIVGPSTYVVATSKKNELILPDKTHWTGQDKDVHQAVCFFNGKIYDPVEDKNTFSLADSLLVSFEGDKIYFFDFKTFKGGFYQR